MREHRIDLHLNYKLFAQEGGMTVVGGIPLEDIGRRELPDLVPMLPAS